MQEYNIRRIEDYERVTIQVHTSDDCTFSEVRLPAGDRMNAVNALRMFAGLGFGYDGFAVKEDGLELWISDSPEEARDPWTPGAKQCYAEGNGIVLRYAPTPDDHRLEFRPSPIEPGWYVRGRNWPSWTYMGEEPDFSGGFITGALENMAYDILEERFKENFRETLDEVVYKVVRHGMDSEWDLLEETVARMFRDPEVRRRGIVTRHAVYVYAKCLEDIFH